MIARIGFLVASLVMELVFTCLMVLVLRYGLGISTLSADLDQLDEWLGALIGDDRESVPHGERFGGETTRSVHIVIPDNPPAAS